MAHEAADGRRATAGSPSLGKFQSGHFKIQRSAVALTVAFAFEIVRDEVGRAHGHQRADVSVSVLVDCARVDHRDAVEEKGPDDAAQRHVDQPEAERRDRKPPLATGE